MASQIKLTPCGAMFDIFKRAAHLSHIELCGMVLSSRPLADGRSPQSRAADRSWVSRFIVLPLFLFSTKFYVKDNFSR